MLIYGFYVVLLHKIARYYVGFEVSIAVVMKIYIFWDLVLCFRWKSIEVSEEHIASIFRVEE
jgi:hypothetical protein